MNKPIPEVSLDDLISGITNHNKLLTYEARIKELEDQLYYKTIQLNQNSNIVRENEQLLIVVRYWRELCWKLQDKYEPNQESR
jgi:hypothetical protein